MVRCQAGFLDRHVVTGDYHELVYYDEGVRQYPIRQQPDKSVAQFSLDCSPQQLHRLLEMLLTFHASYKYAYSTQIDCFEKNVQLMVIDVRRSE